MNLITERLPEKHKLAIFYLKDGRYFVGSYSCGATAIGSISSEDMNHDYDDWDNGFDPIKCWEYISREDSNKLIY